MPLACEGPHFFTPQIEVGAFITFHQNESTSIGLSTAKKNNCDFWFDRLCFLSNLLVLC